MEDWYYVQNGEQKGPVRLETLRRMAESGELRPEDKVWSTSMTDWTPASEVDGIIFPSDSPEPSPATSPPTGVEIDTSTLEEIPPGSEPIDVSRVLSRTFDLLKRHIGILLLVGVFFFGLNIALSTAFQTTLLAAGANIDPQLLSPEKAEQVETMEDLIEFLQPVIEVAPTFILITFIFQLVSGMIHLFLNLGLTRICLRLSDNQGARLSMLFGEGGKYLKALGAAILCNLAILFALILLIIPGIYLSIKLSAVTTAIVDRNMGVMEAIKYSFEITNGQCWRLVLLWLVAVLVGVGLSMITCGWGVHFVIPIIGLGSVVSYRWMQYGARSIGS